MDPKHKRHKGGIVNYDSEGDNNDNDDDDDDHNNNNDDDADDYDEICSNNKKCRIIKVEAPLEW